MKNGLFLFLGIFGALALSWAVVVLGASRQITGLKVYFDPVEGEHYPYAISGVSAEGELVYKDLGCIACHTQQVRRPGFGYDALRSWGKRQSVARDYIYQTNPPLGQMRRGPDLANFGPRSVRTGVDRTKLLIQLHGGTAGMPPFPFLFEIRPVIGTPLTTALPVEGPSDSQVIPTQRAEMLVAYLKSLKQDYVFPEAEPFEPPEEPKY
jgi:cytochrome c oxidase cbb3-type subunit 2